MQLSISHEVNQLKHSRKHNLNLFALQHLRNNGFEVAIRGTQDRLIFASRIDPILRLLEKNIISTKEYEASRRYSLDFEKCNQSNHARPTLIYQGLSHSSASGGSSDSIIDDIRVAASKRVREVIERVARESESRQVKNFKDFKNTKKSHKNISRDKKLLDILSYIFEQGLTIETTKEALNMHFYTITARAQEVAKIICEVYSKKSS